MTVSPDIDEGLHAKQHHRALHPCDAVCISTKGRDLSTRTLRTFFLFFLCFLWGPTSARSWPEPSQDLAVRSCTDGTDRTAGVAKNDGTRATMDGS
jgi:hypothetical protein